MTLFLDCLKAFLVGGAFCALGQVFIDRTKLTPARILVAYVVAGVVLGALGVTELAEGTDLLDQLSDLTGVPVPAPLAGLKDKPVRFRRNVDRARMVDEVLEMLR